jgi:hypothetical protein
MEKSKFPANLYVRIDVPDDDPVAYFNVAGAIIDDGPTVIGVYKLVGTRTVRKEVVNA